MGQRVRAASEDAEPRRGRGRIIAGYWLDMLELGRGSLDLVDSLIMASIVQANVSALTLSPRLSRTFGPVDAPPPDELRRPTPLRRLAEGLGMPQETVRRRVHGLARRGMCEICADGVRVPTQVVASDSHRKLVASCDARTRELLQAFGHPADIDGALVRVRTRLATDFALRLARLATASPVGLRGGLVMAAIIERQDAPGARRPSAAQIAARLKLHPEKVRRALAALRARGYLVSGRIPPDVLSGPEARVAYGHAEAWIGQIAQRCRQTMHQAG